MLAMCLGVKKVAGISSLLHNELAVRKYRSFFYRAIIAQIVCMQNQIRMSRSAHSLSHTYLLFCNSMQKGYKLTPRMKVFYGAVI